MHSATDQHSPWQFVSKNTWATSDFLEAFPDGKMPWNRPFGPITVTQAGGYYPLTIEHPEHAEDGASASAKLLVFVKTGDIDSLTFMEEQPFEFVNVYQAINDNSRYAFVVEFFVAPTEIKHLEDVVTARLDNTEYGRFKETLVIRNDSRERDSRPSKRTG